MSNVKKFNRATFFQGLVAGVLLTHVTLFLNHKSILNASLFAGFYALGTAFSSKIKFLPSKVINLVALLFRLTLLTLTFLSFSNYLNFLLVGGGFLLAVLSRRQFIDLKTAIGQVEITELTRHGSFNALGYGFGSAFAGFLLTSDPLAYSSILFCALLAYGYYPVLPKNNKFNNSGLSKRDVWVAVFFTAAITPLSNAVVLIVIADLYTNQLSGLAVLAYSTGSIFSSKLGWYLRERNFPIAKSVWAGALLFVPILLTGNLLVILATRFLTGSFLYNAQGLLEERTHKESVGQKGLDYLWTLFSLVSFTLILILPKIGQLYGFYLLPLFSFLLGIFISFLRRFIKN